MLEGIHQFFFFDAQLEMEISVVIFAYFDILDLGLDGLDASQQPLLVTIFSILDYTPGEVDPVDVLLVGLEGSILEGIDFFHDFERLRSNDQVLSQDQSFRR